MIPSAVVILSPGFEEIEAVTIIDILRRGGVKVTVAGLDKGIITGSHNIPIQPDMYYLDIIESQFDMLILPGGQPGSRNLKDNSHIIEWLRKRSNEKKKIAAICAAPVVLHEAGIVDGLKITSYPSEKEVFTKSIFKEEKVVKDANFITSRGVGTAIEFSLALVAELVSKEKSDEIRIKILY